MVRIVTGAAISMASAPTAGSYMTAREFVAAVTDSGSWIDMDTPPVRNVDPKYGAQLKRATARSGQSESAVTGTGLIEGQPFVLVVSEFSFLGGSIGQAAADRIIRAIEGATARQLPLLVAPCSGGTRMQEGSAAFARMIDIAEALDKHRSAGLVSLSYLRNPTTGGVFASWGSLTTAVFAEPNALVGFLGPKVYEQLRGASFPPGVQRSDNLSLQGVLDGELTIPELRSVCGALSRLLAQDHAGSRWRSHAGRGQCANEHRGGGTRSEAKSPTLTASILDVCVDPVRLSGDECGSRNTGAELVIAQCAGVPAVVFASGTNPADPDTTVGDLRVARRGMRLAEELQLPFVTIVDTPGGELSVEAENAGMAREIARCLRETARLTVPSVSVLLGRGCGGAALALMGCRRRVALEWAWLSPLPLEGASVLMFGTPDRADEAGVLQRVKADALLEDGVVDLIISPEGPHEHLPSAVLRAIRRAIQAQR